MPKHTEEPICPCDMCQRWQRAMHGPMREHVPKAPFQLNDRVRVFCAVDVTVHDVREHIGLCGVVEYLDYSCGCGQMYPTDPMIGLVLENGEREEFWREEIVKITVNAEAV